MSAAPKLTTAPVQIMVLVDVASAKSPKTQGDIPIARLKQVE